MKLLCGFSAGGGAGGGSGGGVAVAEAAGEGHLSCTFGGEWRDSGDDQPNVLACVR